MIIARFIKDPEGRIQEYRIHGHAGFAENGRDIICAAVSVLALNTANALESLVQAHVLAEADDAGSVICQVTDYQRPEVQLLMNTLLLGLQSVQESYGRQYLDIRC